jgi:hypothetical protein
MVDFREQEPQSPPVTIGAGAATRLPRGKEEGVARMAKERGGNVTFVYEVDERAWWQEDENFPYFVFLGTAIQIGLQATLAARPGDFELLSAQGREVLGNEIRQENDFALMDAAAMLAEQVEAGAIAVFNAQSKLELAQTKKTDIVSNLRGKSARILSQWIRDNGFRYYLDGEELYRLMSPRYTRLDKLVSDHRSQEDPPDLAPYLFIKLARKFGTSKEPTATRKPLLETERKRMLAIMLGMAIDAYGYDVTASRQHATGTKEASIHAALARRGLIVDADTIRKYLAEAGYLLPAEKPRQS